MGARDPATPSHRKASPPINVIIRPLNAACEQEIAWVAHRMRETLIEVLGAARGGGMYDLDWLKGRLEWHLDAEAVTGAVFVAARTDGTLVGHTLVRLDKDHNEQSVGLFATIYVDPAARRQGVGAALIRAGERWMAAQGMATAATYTAPDNDKLHRLFRAHGYALTPLNADFVTLRRAL